MRACTRILVVLLSISGWAEAAEKPTALQVAAAASLQPALAEVLAEIKLTPDIQIQFGGSGTLAQQIKHGAPADVFISASTHDVDSIRDKVGEEVIIAGNSLVVVAPGNATTPTKLDDLAAPKKMAIGNPDVVPVGRYSVEALKSLALFAKVQPLLVFGNTARQVLSYVELATVDAAIVYSTDFVGAKTLRKVIDIDPKHHAKIVYPAVTIRNSPNAARAKEFLQLLTGQIAQAKFAKFGFLPPPGKS
jgi:molybdate transport system substrate-binding protein